jgi:simple sugar transport system ATP-binding protein
VQERDKGRGVLLLSFDLDEIIDLSDRILVLYAGQFVGEFQSGRTQRTEIGLAMGGKSGDEQPSAAVAD